MGFRFHKRINLFGGAFRINLSKSGVGYSYGVKGARVTKTATGKTRATVSLPGSGISYVTESSSKQKNNSRNIQQISNQSQPNSKSGCLGFLVIILFIVMCVAFGFIPALLSMFFILFVVSTSKISKIKRNAKNSAIQEANQNGGNQIDK